MSCLILGYVALNGLLMLFGHVHPRLQGWQPLAVWIAYGVFSPVILSCLFLLYRGNVSVRQIVGACSLLAVMSFLVLITLGMLNRMPPLWRAFDALGFFAASFAAWTCFCSKRASRYLAVRLTKPH